MNTMLTQRGLWKSVSVLCQRLSGIILRVTLDGSEKVIPRPCMLWLYPKSYVEEQGRVSLLQDAKH